MARKKRQTRAPGRPGKKSATRCGKTPSINSTKESTSAEPVVKEEELSADEITPEESHPADEFVCTMCQDTYREPKLLECMHTFCDGCIQMTTYRNNGYEEVMCPICRYVTKAGPDGSLKLLPNKVVEQKMKHNELAIKKENEGPKCAECEQEFASKLCQDCPLQLCDSCSVHHKKCARFKDHNIHSIEAASNEVLFENKPEQCLEHALEFKLFCVTCQVRACSECVHTTTHRGHAFHSLNDIMDLALNNFNATLVNYETWCNWCETRVVKIEKLNAKAIAQRAVSREHVEDAFTQLIEVLHQEKQKLLDWLDKDSESSNNSLKLAKEKVSHVKSMASYLREVSTLPKEKIFNFLKDGISRMKSDVNRMALSSQVPATDLISEDSGDDQNEFNAVIRSCLIDTSDRFANIKSSLQQIGLLPDDKVDEEPSFVQLSGGFKFIKSIYPSLRGRVTFKASNINKMKGEVWSEPVQIGTFMWRVKVTKKKGKKFDEDDEAGCFVYGTLGDKHSGSGKCRASFGIVLKSQTGGQNFNFSRGTNDFLSTSGRCYGATFKKVGLNWKSLVDQGLVKGDTMEVQAGIAIDSWEDGP